jgi:hypothetical protein
MQPLYLARIEDLGRGDLLSVDCAACHQVALPTPGFLLRLGLSPQAKGARPEGARQMPRLRSDGTSRRFDQVAGGSRERMRRRLFPVEVQHRNRSRFCSGFGPIRPQHDPPRQPQHPGGATFAERAKEQRRVRTNPQRCSALGPGRHTKPGFDPTHRQSAKRQSGITHPASPAAGTTEAAALASREQRRVGGKIPDAAPHSGLACRPSRVRSYGPRVNRLSVAWMTALALASPLGTDLAGHLLGISEGFRGFPSRV